MRRLTSTSRCFRADFRLQDWSCAVYEAHSNTADHSSCDHLRRSESTRLEDGSDDHHDCPEGQRALASNALADEECDHLAMFQQCICARSQALLTSSVQISQYGTITRMALLTQQLIRFHRLHEMLGHTTARHLKHTLDTIVDKRSASGLLTKHHYKISSTGFRSYLLNERFHAGVCVRPPITPLS